MLDEITTASFRDRDSSVCTVTRLRTGKPRNRGSIPDRSKRVVSSSKRPERLGPHPPSYLMRNESIYPGLKQLEREVEYSILVLVHL